MTQLLFYALIAGLFSLVGGILFLLVSSKVLKYLTWMLAFAAGAFLAVSLLDVLPEAVEMVEEPHNVFIAALVGFTVFFAFERFLMKYFHTHEAENDPHHGDHTESLPILVIIGDSLHNFLDGVLIALAYIANPALGLTTSLAIAAHEIPQEIGDFSILLDQGWSKLKIIAVNVFTSLLTLLGAGVGYYAATFFEAQLPYLLGGVAGVFLYIAASDLIPEIHHRARHKYLYSVLVFFILGLVVIGYLIMKTHAE